MREKIAGITGNGCQRSTEIVRDGAQQRRAQAFVFNLNSGLLLLPCVLLCLTGCLLQLDSERGSDERGQKHDEKGHRIARFQNLQGKAGINKKVIEHQHRKYRGYCAAGPMRGADGNQKNPQKIRHHDGGF